MTNPHEAALEAAARALMAVDDRPWDGVPNSARGRAIREATATITAYLTAMREAGSVVLVELIMEAEDQEPFVCAQEGVFADEESAREWVRQVWPLHKDHGHVIEINPQKDDGTDASIFASFVFLPFGRGLSGPMIAAAQEGE